MVSNDKITWVEVSKQAIINNYHLLSSAVNPTKIIAVLKADAYGHGAYYIANLINADMIAVARIEEALALRKQAIQTPILVLSPLLNIEAIKSSANYDLDLVIHTEEAVNILTGISQDKTLNVWLKIDTGMHRLGVKVENAIATINKLQQQPGVKLKTIMTHFSESEDEYSNKTQIQMQHLSKIMTQFPKLPVSCANSGAILFHQDKHLNWARTGLALYGINPSSQKTPLTEKLIPVMTFKSRVIAIKDVSAGSTVGYNSRWKAPSNTRIAVIAAGYGDGYPRSVKNGTPVLIHQKPYFIVGNISMDLMTVEIGEDNIKAGDIVELWGKSLSAKKIATQANTICYELLTQVSPRVTRNYID